MKINSICERDRLFVETVKDMLANEKVQSMKSFVQHGNVSCYEHCLMVCLYGYVFAKHHNIKIDIKAFVHGALLHDFFLYDWHDNAFTRDGLHGFSHPTTARRNAAREFDLSDKELSIIYTHMWPLTIKDIPRSKEAWLVCMADKYCSLKETLQKKPY